MKVWISDTEKWPVPYYDRFIEEKERDVPPDEFGPFNVPEEILKAYDEAQSDFEKACAALNSYRKNKPPVTLR